jgi:hypothetical protein
MAEALWPTIPEIFTLCLCLQTTNPSSTVQTQGVHSPVVQTDKYTHTHTHTHTHTRALQYGIHNYDILQVLWKHMAIQY